MYLPKSHFVLNIIFKKHFLLIYLGLLILYACFICVCVRGGGGVRARARAYHVCAWCLQRSEVSRSPALQVWLIWVLMRAASALTL